MKKYIALILIAFVLIGVFIGCTTGTTEDIANRDQEEAEASGLTIHKIGVATYDIKDAQVMMFKDYLDNYIKECFVDVTFLYSESISSDDELMEFLELCAEEGVEGVMAFGSYDLKRVVDFCAENEMYVIRPSATSSDEEFDSVASNPYFIGEIGPGIELEYEEAEKMTRALAEEGKSYVILSGGASMSNEMHRLRTLAMLDALQDIYGVSFEESSEQLALVTETTLIEADGLKVIICPGYLTQEDRKAAASEVIASGEYTTVLSTIPVTDLMDALNSVDIECGVIDCFSEDNYFGFKKGKIAYVAGKYQSEIGPAFAAVYNAVTGNAEVYRVDGKAFRLEQGFWTAANDSEYDSMYALACGATINAYNYEDLYSVIKSITPEADFEAFKKLTESYSYEDCLARRSA